MQKLKGNLILTVVAIIWGIAFVAQDTASQHVGAFTFNAARNILATLSLGILVLKKHQSIPKKQKLISKKDWIAGFWIGFILFIAEFLQQTGIGSYPPSAAASGRSGFITSIYVVIVALCAWFIGRNRNPIIFLAVVFGLAGMYFLCITNSLNNIYFGDILNFLSAFAFAGHILVIDYYRNHDSLIISWLQFIFAGGFALIFALFIEHPALTDILQAALPIAYAGIISSGVGYTLQIIGQKYADPTASSIILSTEAVFSAIAGWIILNQVMSPREIFGATLVFAAVIIAQIPDIIKFSKKSL